nr:hypothetical protein CFP56_09430 [Quercus suber]
MCFELEVELRCLDRKRGSELRARGWIRCAVFQCKSLQLIPSHFICAIAVERPAEIATIPVQRNVRESGVEGTERQIRGRDASVLASQQCERPTFPAWNRRSANGVWALSLTATTRLVKLGTFTCKH